MAARRQKPAGMLIAIAGAVVVVFAWHLLISRSTGRIRL